MLEWLKKDNDNEGRNEASQIGTIQSIQNGTFFERFKEDTSKEDKRHLFHVFCKSLALIDNPLDEALHIQRFNLHLKNLYHSSIQTAELKKAINKEKDILKLREKEQNKKDVERYKVPNGILELQDYYYNVKLFYKINPFFYDKNRLFWLWDKEKFCYSIVDEVQMIMLLNIELGFDGKILTTGLSNNYIEAFRVVGRENHPKDAPKKWIQFKDKAFSLKSHKIYDVTPQYFFTNPIPHEIGETSYTPIMDKLFTEWVGEDRREALYELLAYCCYSDYPIQLLFCLWGNGRNGKSQFLRIMDKFIGSNNVTTSDLETLSLNRFESFKLYKKLLCVIGETNFNILNNTGFIKRLVGGDKIRFEKKNKDSFDDYNYAKIVISSNSLPSSKDTTDGFYRRWFIMPFENEFEEIGREIWLDVPDEEYKSLAKKVTEILPNLLGCGVFKGQGTIEQRKKNYLSVSNPMTQFINDCCEVSEKGFVEYNKLYTYYTHYLTAFKRRKVSRNEFKGALEDEGYTATKTTKTVKVEDEYNDFTTEYKTLLWVDGISLKKDYANYAIYTHFIGLIKRERERNI